MTAHGEHPSKTPSEPVITYRATPTGIGESAWRALSTHYEKVRDLHLRDLFAHDPKRGERLTAVAAGANVLVAGSAIFRDSEGVTAAVERLGASIRQSKETASIRRRNSVNELSKRERGGVICATRNDRTWKDGREHGAPASHGRPSVHHLRQVAERGEGVDSGESGGSFFARGSCEEAREAAGRLADGAGRGCDQTIADLLPHLEPDDILIDGGNSYYVDDIRRAKELAPKKGHYVDVGTSGGVWGLARGYCMADGHALPLYPGSPRQEGARHRHRQRATQANAGGAGGTNGQEPERIDDLSVVGRCAAPVPNEDH